MSIINIKSLAKYVSIALLLLFMLISLAYAFKPGYLDHGEPGVTILAMRLIQGLSVYPDPDIGQRIVLSYGPALYLTQSIGVFLFSNPILGSKLIGVVVSLLAVGLFFLALRRRIDSAIALYVSALVVYNLLWFKHISFWNRPEPLILLSVAIFLYSLTSKKPQISLILASLALSILINSKIFAVIYVLPLLWLWFKQFGQINLIKMSFLTLIFSVLPFLLYNQFPLPFYIYWLRDMGTHEFLIKILLNNLSTSIILTIPSCILLVGHFIQKDRPNNLIIIHLLNFTMFIGVSIIASKVGAGSYYFLGCIPTLFYINALSLDNLRSNPPSIALSKLARHSLIGIVGFWFIYLLAMAAVAQADLFKYLLNPRYALLEEDIRSVRAQLGSSVQMGYGEGKGYRDTFVRPWLYKNNPDYVLDAMSYWDMQMAHLPSQPALLDQFRQKTSEYWVIPRDNEPFMMRLDLYSHTLAPVRPLFPDINDVFLQNYQLVDHSTYFDIWQAKP